MAALPLIITNAGAALIAQVGQIGPVQLSQLAVGTSAWTPDATATALRAQVTEFPAVGSVSASSGMIHITAQDTSAAAYTACELGIFTSTGVLFAIYSQPTPIYTKAVGSVGLVAADFVISGLPPGAVTVGQATFSYPLATQEAPGVAQIATQDEVNAGVDGLKIVTPATLSEYGGAFLQKANNLSDLTNVPQARLNLSLGTAAVQNIAPAGNANAGQAVMGNDTRLTDQRTPLPVSVTPSTMAPGAAVGNLGFTPVNKAGDTMTGALILPANPANALQAATKQYVDGNSTFGAVDSKGNPLGYVQFPGGLIMQWGKVSIPAATGTTFNFPIPFPNACLSVQLTKTTSDGETVRLAGMTKTAATMDNYPGTSATPVYVLAIGY